MSDSADLEREAEAARARLSDTADQLRARMSPGQLMDEVLGQFRGDGNAMLANLRNQARDNPMALALVGSGLAWLMMGSGSQDTHSSHTRGRVSSYPTSSRGLESGYGASSHDNWGTQFPDESGRSLSERSLSESSLSESGSSGSSFSESGSSEGGSSEGGTLSSVGKSVSGLAQGASSAIASAGQAVGDRLHRTGDQAGMWAHDLHSAGSDAMSSAAHGVSDAVHGVRHSAADLGYQARSGFLDILEREPLVIGALGVAVGAAIGALLPATDIERQHLGPAGQALKSKATALVDQGVSGAKEMASEVYETAREEADRQGLLPGDTPIAEKVGAVVRAAGEKVGTAVEQQTSSQEDAPPSSNENKIDRI